MGQRNSKNTVQNKQQVDLQQIRICCGFPFQSHGDNMNKQIFNWQTYGIEFCTNNSGSTFWASDVANLLKKNASEKLKSKYIKQFNNVQKNKRNQLRSSNGTQLSGIGNKNYKQNLQNSILLHQNQINKTSNINRNTIQSKMEVNLDNQRRSIKKSIFNSQMFNKIAMNKGQQYPFPRMSHGRNSTSLPNERISFLFQQKDEQISNQKSVSLNYFIQYSTLLQKHLTDPQHELFKIIQQLKKTLYQKYKQNNKLTQQQMQQLIRNMKMFIFFIAQLVRGYYSIDDLQKYEQESVRLIRIQDNLVTLITTILFKNDTFYNFVFQAIKRFNKENDSNYSNYLKLQKQHHIQNINNQIKVPYQKCSQILIKINKSKTPISKMKLILQCAQKISQCIAECYRSKQIKLENQLLDADQILSIFCQILAIKQIEYMSSHLFFIDSFATQNHKISITGYYFSVLTCAVNKLSNSKQQIQENCGKGGQDTIQMRNRQKGSLILSIPSQRTG